jgi:hypothetical protein
MKQDRRWRMETTFRLLEKNGLFRRVLTHDTIQNGSVTVKDGDYTFKCRIEDEHVKETKEWLGKTYTKWTKYGEFHKTRKYGTFTEIAKYHKNSRKSLHGLSMLKTTLFNIPGRSYSFYSRGSLLWQKFVYSNGVVAYFAKRTDKKVVGKYPNGRTMFEIEADKINIKPERWVETYWGEPFVKNQVQMYSKSGNCSYVLYDRKGRIKNKGKFVNRQQVGEIIRNYQQFFFLSGIEVPKKLYETDPKDLNPNIVLKMNNSQVRAMFLKRIGLNRVVKECNGVVVDNDFKRKNTLYEFPIPPDGREGENADKVLRILKVTCTSTASEYFLRVPPTKEFDTCEKARQGTFNGFEPSAEPIKFKLET